MEDTKERYNVKLYPIYKMISWDLLFYYSISFLFFTQIKHISASNVLLSEAFYNICRVILMFPLTAMISKLGKRKSIIIGNMVNALSILSYIVGNGYFYVLLGQLFSAIAFNIKGIVETNLLYDNLPRNEKRGHLFSKIDGRGSSWYYYIDAVASLLSGFLYIINGYLPFILCLVCCLISTILSICFKETEKKGKEEISTKQYIKNLRNSFKYMMQSERLSYLFIFGAIFSGLLSFLVSPRTNILEQINIPEQYIGVIFAVLGIISGISAKNQNKIHNKFRNKTLAMLAIPTTLSCMLIGFCILGKLPIILTLVIILVLYIIQYIAKGAFYTLIKRYLNNFTHSNLRDKIMSAYNLIECISKSVLLLLASWLLKATTASNAVLFIGCITTIAIVLLLDKMRNKVGLKPEEYKKEDIEFLDIK